VQTYPDGNWYRGDQRHNQDYRSYGQPVYAVADGTITEEKDGIPENTPGPTSRAVEITFETLAGNHVIERIGDGVHATAHLQPGSLRVRIGDRVHRGQVLGLLGNSGNSDAPHLHFQICDANSVLGCEGLPYAISSFDVEGLWKPDGSITTHALELPTEGEVVRFTTEHEHPCGVNPLLWARITCSWRSR
jgi:murein DD-endopeptidase MepM/ murein hydrolase activator NlpD